MCGRFANSRSDAQLVAAFGIDEVESAELPPSYNVAPTQQPAPHPASTPPVAPC
jgi:putative SOS response-associated peptidase YedK